MKNVSIYFREATHQGQPIFWGRSGAPVNIGILWRNREGRLWLRDCSAIHSITGSTRTVQAEHWPRPQPNFAALSDRAGTHGASLVIHPVTDWHGAGAYVRRPAWAGSRFVHSYSHIQSRRNSRLALVGSRCHDRHSRSRHVRWALNMSPSTAASSRGLPGSSPRPQ
jgi:hypothetical protein